MRMLSQSGKYSRVLAESVAEFQGGLFQVVVLDHAAADVWGEVTGVHLVEEWRDRKKLIPLEWLEWVAQTGMPPVGANQNLPYFYFCLPFRG